MIIFPVSNSVWPSCTGPVGAAPGQAVRRAAEDAADAERGRAERTAAAREVRGAAAGERRGPLRVPVDGRGGHQAEGAPQDPRDGGRVHDPGQPLGRQEDRQDLPPLRPLAATPAAQEGQLRGARPLRRLQGMEGRHLQ